MSMLFNEMKHNDGVKMEGLEASNPVPLCSHSCDEHNARGERMHVFLLFMKYHPKIMTQGK